MPFGERQMAGGVQSDDEASLQSRCIERLAADQSLQQLPTQPRVRRHPCMAEKMVQRLVDRPGVLLGLRQTIEVDKNVTIATIQFEIELPARAELKQIKGQTPPNEKTLVVNDEGLEARVGNPIQPVVELRPEMSYGSHEGVAEIQDRPRRLLRSWTWLRTSIRLSSEISRSRACSLWCSSIHERTSSVKSIGTYIARALP